MRRYLVSYSFTTKNGIPGMGSCQITAERDPVRLQEVVDWIKKESPEMQKVALMTLQELKDYEVFE